MKPTYISHFLVGILTVFCLSCHKPEPVEPQPDPGPHLSQVVEVRYTPEDSVTIDYFYNSQGQLLQEKYMGVPGIKNTYSQYYLHNPTDLTGLKDFRNYYRFNFYNASQQLTSSRKYFTQYGTYWAVSDSDTMIYQQNRLVRQEHRDFYFSVDGMGVAFKYPLWLTKRSFSYDNQNRVITETDSVFATHDFPVGSVVIYQAPTRYLFTNRTTYEYNEASEVIRKVAVSGMSESPSPKFSNGWSIYDQLAPYSLYSGSWPVRYLPGITTYRYEHQPDGKVSKKTASFEDAKTNQLYVSTFTYQYEP